MIRKNQHLVTDEPVEVQDCMKTTDHFRGIYRIYPNLVKENRRMSTCNRLDLQTLGSQPIMPKNLPGHYPVYYVYACLVVGLRSNSLIMPPLGLWNSTQRGWVWFWLRNHVELRQHRKIGPSKYWPHDYVSWPHNHLYALPVLALTPKLWVFHGVWPWPSPIWISLFIIMHCASNMQIFINPQIK